MKMTRTVTVLTAVVALAASYALAGEHTVTFSSTTFSTTNGVKIIKTTLNNKALIADCTTNKGAQLLYITSNSSSTNLLVTADKCGNILCTNTLVLTGQASGTVIVTNGTLIETVASIPFTIVGGGSGTLLVDEKKVTTTRSTNTTAKAQGLVTSASGHVGTVTLTINGSFTAPRSCD